MTRKERQMTSRSEAIRACHRLHPEWDAAQIRSHLAAQDVTVSNSLIYQVLWADKNKTKATKKRRPESDVVSDLILVKRFVGRVGGTDAARRPLDALAKILA